MNKYLRLSKLSYNNDEKFLGENCTVRFYDGQKLERSDVQFYTLDYEDELVIAIRGSSSISDFMNDSFCWTENFFDVNEKGCRVHAGFVEQYLSMRMNMLIEVFHAFSKNKKRVTFTGHSLGGALATICGCVVKNTLPELCVSVYTYGSPRVGNKIFAKLFEAVDVSIRVVNGSDPVTTIPYWGYEHVKGETLIGHKSFTRISDHYLVSYEESTKNFGFCDQNIL